jgi:hypothetical protein
MHIPHTLQNSDTGSSPCITPAALTSQLVRSMDTVAKQTSDLSRAGLDKLACTDVQMLVDLRESVAEMMMRGMYAQIQGMPERIPSDREIQDIMTMASQLTAHTMGLSVL